MTATLRTRQPQRPCKVSAKSCVHTGT